MKEDGVKFLTVRPCGQNVEEARKVKNDYIWRKEKENGKEDYFGRSSLFGYHAGF